MRVLTRVGRLFPRNDVEETVQTTLHLDASPAGVWQALLFYEEVPHRPSVFLRLLLPVPVRTEGEKTRVGAMIHCTYDRGSLEKRITAVEPGHAIRFDVTEQHLGIEDCASTTRGSYELVPEADGTAVVLTTVYRGHLRPRWLFRPFERLLVHALHGHILDGMHAALEFPVRDDVPVLRA